MNKKGAIEFSMTTIMIIIIGIAVLALGLAWVQGTFEQIDIITDTSLASAETVLFEGTHTGKISAPSNIILKPGQIKKFEIWVRNDNVGSDTFTLKTIAAVSESCAFVTEVVSGTGLTLAVGEETKLVGVVKAASACTSGQTGTHKVTINDGAGVYGEEAITFTIRT